jgi:hypothetical protein
MRQYRLTETLIIAFLTGVLTSLGAAVAGLTPDNWRIVVPGIIAAALIAGLKAVTVAWANYGGTTPIVELSALAPPGSPPWFHLVPGNICQRSGQYRNSRTGKQATCVAGERMPPGPKGSWWLLTDRTRHADD